MRNNGKATLNDLKRVNNVVKRIRMKNNEVKFTKIGEKKYLIVTGIGDASFKTDEKLIGGNFVLLRNRQFCHCFGRQRQLRKCVIQPQRPKLITG